LRKDDLDAAGSTTDTKIVRVRKHASYVLEVISSRSAKLWQNTTNASTV